jgi:sortase A
VSRQRRPAEDLSIEELRHLLMEKRRAERETRLDRFRKTGRVVVVEPEPAPRSLDALRTGTVSEDDDQEGSDSADAAGTRSERRSNRRVWIDRFLFVVEIAAVVGLLLVLVNGMSVLRNLNKEVASVLVQPTLTPTPLVSAVVLPSGHTPPNSPGGVAFNDAEIPEHLRPLVQSLANLPVPTAGPQQAVRIQVPAIGVDAPIVQGDGWEQLKKGVAQHVGTANPGEKGNLVLSAHNDVFGEIFKDLDKLKEGDTVTVFTSQRTFTYVIRQTQIVEPTQVEVMKQGQEAVVTLISCYPYMKDNQRIVVTAYLQEEQ